MAGQDDAFVGDETLAGAQEFPPEMIQVQVVHHSGTTADRISAKMEGPLVAVWTRNRVYHLDRAFRCIAVVDRATGTEDPKHALLGATLMGGERKYAKSIHLSRPFPVPGTEAVFSHGDKRGQVSRTSVVERVVLVVSVASVQIDTSTSGWDDVTAAVLKFGLK